jgi:hypothetical protein
MTFGELVNDYDRDIDEETNTLHEYFVTLEDGDAIIVRDAINDIVYREESDDTGIEFVSFIGERFSINGDVTNEFVKGDYIEITLHIISVNYTQQNANTGEIWTFNRETLQEGWDSKNNAFVPIPQRYIHHASKDETKKIMTFEQFSQGYNQTSNDYSKKIIYDFLLVDEGDTLFIWDTIDNITYEGTNGYTTISLVSSPGSRFRIQGNITDQYKKKDDIEIELNMIKTIFTDINPYTNETWTYEIETFKEIWDNTNRVYIPLPQEYIRHR